MSSSEIRGIRLADLQDPIITALGRFADLSDTQVLFDVDAGKLQLTPDKPYTARCSSPAYFLDSTSQLLEPSATLHVLAFAPGDATGAESSYKLDNINTGRFPREPKYVPRLKTDMLTEAHLALAAINTEYAHAEPTLFAGSLSVLGLSTTRDIDNRRYLTQLGYVGQPPEVFADILRDGHCPEPTATLCVGYSDRGMIARRFGDPHAILSETENVLQIAGFLAISNKAPAKHHHVLAALGAQEFSPDPA